VEYLTKLPINHKELCSPMVLDNIVHFRENSLIDGCYISLDSNMILFEEIWEREISEILSKAIQEAISQ